MYEIRNSDLDYFMKNIYEPKFSRNFGGMRTPDMFSLFFILKKINPKIVIESGVHNGWSTLLIRKTLGKNVKIISIDPKNIAKGGYVDNNINTIYYTGDDFIDFNDLDISNLDTNDIFCFFDDHINAFERLKQCIDKNIKHILFNDNYPINVGGFYSLEHYIKNDNTFYSVSEKEREIIDKLIDIYHIFPNIFKSIIPFNEGNAECEYIYENMDSPGASKYYIFFKDKSKYTFNTYVKLH
tara:strand:+ start:16343 stop:17062 length:720 start_codon:yes stop_codon:yes gene_type:complete